ncbi:MAG: response regulator [Prolixibacteraceae bacterium]|nr:response regulator [Prolixibacteraceae bacterium]
MKPVNTFQKKIKEKLQIADDSLKPILEELLQHLEKIEQENSELTLLLKKLHGEKEHFTGLFNNAPIGYLIIDDDFRITEVNNTACESIGEERQDLLGKPFLKKIDPGFHDTFYRYYKNLETGKNIAGCDVKLLTPASQSSVRLVGSLRKPPKGEKQQLHLALFEIFKEEQQETTEPPAHKNSDNVIETLAVLVAEDDEIARMYLSELLEGKCRKLLFAHNGKEAVELYQANSSIDLVLMDIKMPVMDGYSAAIKIKELNKNAIIVAQTAYALASDREKALAAGCSEYLVKPLIKKDLFSVIEKFFD